MEEAKTKEDGQESQDLKLGLSDDGKDSPTAVAPASEVPPDQPTEGPGYLQEGELVEVKQNDKGLRGSWHPAVIVQVLPGKRVVEYEELVTPDGLEKLKETIPFRDSSKSGSRALRGSAKPKKWKLRIRPRPPPAPSSSTNTWIAGTCVDCFYQDAWWEGILKEDLIDESDKKVVASKTVVTVYFPDEKDVSEHDVTNLRPTQDWDEKTGTWNQRPSHPTLASFKKQSRDERKATTTEAEDPREIDQPQGNIALDFENAGEASGDPTFEHLDEEEDSITYPQMEQGDGTHAASSDTDGAATQWRQRLKDAGWKVNVTTLESGKRKWSYGPPESQGADNQSPKLFSTLSSAAAEFTKLLQEQIVSEDDSTIFTLKDVTSSRVANSDPNESATISNTAIVVIPEADKEPNQHQLELTEDEARACLTEKGWSVNKIIRHHGRIQWQYKAPGLSDKPILIFHTLCGAIEEYNRRLKTSADGDGQAELPIGLIRTKQVSNKTRKRTEDNDHKSIKRTHCSVEPEGMEISTGGKSDSDPDIDLLADTFAKSFRQDSQDPSHYPSEVEMDHQDNRCTNSDKKTPVRCTPEGEKYMNELQIEVDTDEAREYLREAGWTIREIVRKGRTSWFYKAPAFGSSPAATYQSLSNAMSEYNSRVVSTNQVGVEQRPLFVLRNRSGKKLRNLHRKTDEGISPRTNMDDVDQNPSCGTGTAPRADTNPSSVTREQGRRFFPPREDERESEKEFVAISSPEEISANAVEPLAFASSINEDVKSVVRKPFGSLIGDVFEDDRVYLLQVYVLDFKKEQLQLYVEGDSLVIKGTYFIDNPHSDNKFSTKHSGALSCRLMLPDDVIHASITASQLKPETLHLTLRKAVIPLKKFQISIK
ncbi:hypothetical protein MPTK1_6g20670 [Marchantia polymorpha subsp. ruderalis]|uniref:SHSP domain-containing protein n=2 Tax=Marchantia polymorpha TaxID=3197 RepID=A0A176VTU2_MARPO|nr:hypothetical protein AXG93_2752s2370 [Marchantia polymorpha subsp. ruderalis]PTQ33246.1 hypothetical protein MARPO_0091s0090 [Marchantia polymorpha]PTQ33247.1 hypothetical protein MARPO_0091s0090 [Marchantia polymorpha]BBN15573.1 hypothetical protein Mp_6g20670 [Marchantia polymorpha subsp. ruderalis]BBN15574.1 hypothetical protein Mp_6g20670 [Marchantia polymorpha subsp. ruderalis]|eukprot:PTQ33246.1 hypothetical protein MARPO_0091s0090 [Marchantia polymorpha]